VDQVLKEENPKWWKILFKSTYWAVRDAVPKFNPMSLLSKKHI